MENASAAVKSLFAGAPNTPTDSATSNSKVSGNTNDQKFETADADVAPAVEHTHVKKEHETKVQKEVERERHQDHYHTTVQPLKDSETRPEKNDYTEETHHKNVDHDNKAAKKANEADRAGFKSTTDQKTFEGTTTEPTKTKEHIHHHLHETIQPVIEKEVIDPSVTHHKVNIKEKHQDPSVNHGVTTNSAIGVDEFKNTLGDKNLEKK